MLLARFAPWQAQALAGWPSAVLAGARFGPPGRAPDHRHRRSCRRTTPRRPTRSSAGRSGSLGIAQINAVLKPDKEGRAPGHPVHLRRDARRAGLVVPAGPAARGQRVSDILARRESLASGLRRPLSATWPAGVPEEHPGRLDLWVGMHDISKQKPPPCPLLKARQTDLFDVIPFGTDPRLRPVKVPDVRGQLADRRQRRGRARRARCGCWAARRRWTRWPTCGFTSWPARATLSRWPRSATATSPASMTSRSPTPPSRARLLRNETERRSATFKKLKGTGAMPDGKVTRELAGQVQGAAPAGGDLR